MRRADINCRRSWSSALGSESVHQDLKDRIGGLAPTAALLLFDRRGKLLNASSDWPLWPVNDADQDIFRDLAVAGTPQPLISAPRINAAAREWTIHLSRKLDAPEGA